MKRRLKSSLLRCSEYDMPVAVTVTFLAKSSKRNLTFICSFFNKLLFEQQVIFCHQSDSCVHSSSRVRLLFIRSSREFSLDYASLISRSQSTGDFRRHYFTCPQKWILSLLLSPALICTQRRMFAMIRKLSLEWLKRHRSVKWKFYISRLREPNKIKSRV